MSSPTSAQHIPVGKLVSVTGRPGRARAGPESLEQALPERDREVPWLIFSVVGGIGAWLVALGFLAVSGMRPETPRAVTPALPVVLAAAAEVPLPPVANDDADPDVPLPQAAVGLPPRRPAPFLPEPPPLAPLAEPPPDPGLPVERAGLVCDKLGTSIAFVKNPPDAFRQARKEGKLVFMVHLSGNFEDTQFT
jgi:hypothetical protein